MDITRPMLDRLASWLKKGVTAAAENAEPIALRVEKAT
jgi:hypothetical protein